MNRLQQLRIDARLTRDQLAEQVGVTAVTIGNLENGKGARVETLGRIADVFEVQPSTLLRPAFPELDAA